MRAWRAGFGTDTIDPLDEDMRDAEVLSISDGTGALLWSPRSLDDFDRLPERTFRLWLDIRDGMAAARDPWRWLRRKGTPTAHHFEASPLGPTTARCGQTAGDGEWVDGGTPCRACSALAERNKAPAQAWGQIGDSIVGPDGRAIPIEVTR